MIRGALAVTDTVKPSAAATVAELRRLGLRPVLLTGDNAATAHAVAAAGIDEVISEALPAAKAQVIRDNVLAIPLAALGFLNPIVAAATMTLSSVFVVWNSLRLRRFSVRA